MQFALTPAKLALGAIVSALGFWRGSCQRQALERPLSRSTCIQPTAPPSDDAGGQTDAEISAHVQDPRNIARWRSRPFYLPCEYLTFSVADFASFESALLALGSDPDGLEAFPHPRDGFAGFINFLPPDVPPYGLSLSHPVRRWVRDAETQFRERIQQCQPWSLPWSNDQAMKTAILIGVDGTILDVIVRTTRSRDLVRRARRALPASRDAGVTGRSAEWLNERAGPTPSNFELCALAVIQDLKLCPIHPPQSFYFILPHSEPGVGDYRLW